MRCCLGAGLARWATLPAFELRPRSTNQTPAAHPPLFAPLQAYLLALGAKPTSGPFPAKAPFWEKPGFLVWTAAATDPAAEEARFVAADPV